MGYGLINTEILTGIASAIRQKLGVQTTYKPGQMADAIESISGGGITPIGTKQITANGTYDVTEFASAEVAVPQSGITPTGTKQVSVTQNGTVTEDVTNYASVEVNTNVVNPDYTAALTALGVQSDLTDGIEALTAYSNGVTGESDTTLSDAVHTLGSGYGGGSGGLEYEEGTYTPATDGLPTISFANSHSTAPDIVLLEDVSNAFPSVGNTGLLFIYMNSVGLFSKAFASTSSTSWDGIYLYGRASTSLTFAAGAAEYTRGNIKNVSFEPFFGTSAMLCRTGQTYKWMAIWK